MYGRSHSILKIRNISLKSRAVYYPSGLRSIKTSVKLPSFSRLQGLTIIQQVWTTSILSTNLLCLLREQKSKGNDSGWSNLSNFEITFREPFYFSLSSTIFFTYIIEDYPLVTHLGKNAVENVLIGEVLSL